MYPPSHHVGAPASERLLVFPSGMDERDIIRLAERYQELRNVDFEQALEMVSQGGETRFDVSVHQEYYVVKHGPIMGWHWQADLATRDADPDDETIPLWDEREQGLWEKQNFR